MTSALNHPTHNCLPPTDWLKTVPLGNGYLLALDAIEHYRRDWFRLSGQLREQSCAVGHGAFLAKYRFRLQFTTAVEKDPMLDTILNDPVPELGLAVKGSA